MYDYDKILTFTHNIFIFVPHKIFIAYFNGLETASI